VASKLGADLRQKIPEGASVGLDGRGLEDNAIFYQRAANVRASKVYGENANTVFAPVPTRNAGLTQRLKCALEQPGPHGKPVERQNLMRGIVHNLCERKRTICSWRMI
jgi:hypothetical protein